MHWFARCHRPGNPVNTVLAVLSPANNAVMRRLGRRRMDEYARPGSVTAQ